MFNKPLAYFITFRTYGTWLHGDEEGSVDRRNNRFGTPKLPPSEQRQQFELEEMGHEPVKLSTAEREVVAAAVRGVCEYKGWALRALNVRTNHVHVVVTAETSPERVMNSLKAWATRTLREEGLAGPRMRVWSRHGSTIYLFQPEKVTEKIAYVLEEQ